MRAATNIQPRKNLPSPVPEFKQITTQVDTASLPPRARKLSTPKRGYVASAAKDQVTIGIHFSPEEFVHEALSLRHPTEQQSLFPTEVKENVTHLSTRTVHQIAIERTEQIRKWTAFAIDTDKEEKASKSTLSHRIADVLKDKRLKLLDRLIKDSGHEDHTLVDDLTKGFDPLTGALPRSGVFSQKFRPASMTCDDLRKISELSKSVIIESLQSSGDLELDQDLFEATMKEVTKGFLEGPVCRSSLPPGSTLTKRFPVKQKNSSSYWWLQGIFGELCRDSERGSYHTHHRSHCSHDILLDEDWELESQGPSSGQVLGSVRCLQASAAFRQRFWTRFISCCVWPFLQRRKSFQTKGPSLRFHCASHGLSQSFFGHLENRIIPFEVDVVRIFWWLPLPSQGKWSQACWLLCEFHLFSFGLESVHSQVAPFRFHLQSTGGTTRPEAVWWLTVPNFQQGWESRRIGPRHSQHSFGRGPAQSGRRKAERKASIRQHPSLWEEAQAACESPLKPRHCGQEVVIQVHERVPWTDLSHSDSQQS